MTQTGQHTPGPWRICNAFADIEIVADTGNDTVQSIVQFKGYQNAQADAAFIVRACNSHQVMLALLQGISRIWSEAEGGSEVMDYLEQRLGAIRHVIAKATE